MPTITPTVERVSQNTVRITYSNMALNDVGAPIGKHWADYADRSVHFSGTFGSNGSVTVEGSNNAGGSYKALTDPQTSAITKTAEAIEQIVEIAELTRPNVTIGDANRAIDVDFYLRRKAEGE